MTSHIKFLYILGACIILITPIWAANLGDKCSSTADCASGLLCENDTCSYCHTNEQCKSEHISLICVAHGDARTCKHKDLLPHVDSNDVGISFLLLILGALAAGGGVGGGGVFLPLLLLINHFTTKEAVPLSNALIFGASIANYAQMFKKRHPNANRPLIDYNLAFVLQPLSIGGTVIGVILHAIFPNWLVLLLLAVTLVITTHRTGKRAVKMWKIEAKTPVQRVTAKEVEDTGENAEAAKSTAGANFDRKDDVEMLAMQSSLGNTEGEIPKYVSMGGELMRILLKESKNPWWLMLAQLGVLVMLLAFAIIRGSSSSRTTSIAGVQGCSAGYWILVWGIFPILGLITFFWARHLVRLNNLKERVNYPFKEGDLRWTAKRAGMICVVALVSGILASLLGIGGGMVLSPVMLELGVLPEITAATSSFMIFFTSFSSLVQFIVSGELLIAYAVWFAILGLVASFLGQTVLNYLVKKYNKKSYIVILVTFIIAASTVLLVATGAINVSHDIKSGASFGFTNPCK